MNFQNENVVERIMAYVEGGKYAEAETLATVVDHLEECYRWEVTVVPFADLD